MTLQILELLRSMKQEVNSLTEAAGASDLAKCKKALKRLGRSADKLRHILHSDSADKAFSDLDYTVQIIDLSLKRQGFKDILSLAPDIESNLLNLIVVTKSIIKQDETVLKQLEAQLSSRNVFIVHGRDLKPANELKRLLSELGFDSIVLEEQATGGSKTIIEKLEDYSKVSYAFVILTADDLALCKDDVCRKNPYDVRQELGELSQEFDTSGLAELLYQYYREGKRDNRLPLPRDFDLFIDGCFRNGVQKMVRERLDRPRKFLEQRARQNVVMEFGYFAGLLGRTNVCCLHKGQVELPSNMHGIAYLHFEKHVKQIRGKIAKELERAGLLQRKSKDRD